jgi:subtilisin family serine protease
MKNRTLSQILSILVLSLPVMPAGAASATKILIFKARAPDGSPAHTKLKKSGKKFRRLQQSGLLLIQSNSEDEKALKEDPDFQYLEEDKIWKTTAYDSVENPADDYWTDDFFEGTATTVSTGEVLQSVVLGVVDSGLKYQHTFFSGSLLQNSKEAGGSSGVDDDHNGYTDDIYGASVLSKNGSVDTNGAEHGTHVASLAKVVIDQSPARSKIKILPVNFMGNGGYGSTASALVAIDYAVSRGAKVLNFSWGSAGEESFSSALYESFIDLYYKDIVVVAAAGNEQNDNDRHPFFPSSFNLPNLVSVASVTPTYYSPTFLSGIFMSYFSNFGAESVDIAAPGDLEIYGNGIGLLGANGDGDYSELPYVRKQGTSMAAPVVSGVAAVIRALNSHLKAHEVKNILLQSSARNPDLEGRVRANGHLDAAQAYAMARSSAGGSARPSLPQNAVKGSVGESMLGRAEIGGCAQIGSTVSEPPEGPFGGNSLILILALYFMFRLLRDPRSLLRKLKTYV